MRRIAAACCVLAALAAAPANAADWKPLADRHDADIRRPGGKDYERKFMSEFQSRYDDVLLGECAPAQGLPESFEMIVVLGKDGGVTDVLLRPENETARCLRKAVLEGGPFAKPPHAPFHLRIRQSFQH